MVFSVADAARGGQGSAPAERADRPPLHRLEERIEVCGWWLRLDSAERKDQKTEDNGGEGEGGF